jgi:hypothetical protein
MPESLCGQRHVPGDPCTIRPPLAKTAGFFCTFLATAPDYLNERQVDAEAGGVESVLKGVQEYFLQVALGARAFLGTPAS